MDSSCLMWISFILSLIFIISDGKPTPDQPEPTTPYPAPVYTRRPFWIKEGFPNPQKDPIQCHPLDNPAVKSYICDPSELILERDENYIKAMIKALSQGGDCQCSPKSPGCTDGSPGIMFSVAMVPRISYQSIKSAKTLTIEFADYLRHVSWKFRGACENDVVLVMSFGQRTAYMSIGKNAEAYLNIKKVDMPKIMAMDEKSDDMSRELTKIVERFGAALNITVSTPEIDKIKANIGTTSASSLSPWTYVAAAALVIGWIIVLSLAGAGAAYCGKKCRGSEEEQARRKVKRATRSSTGVTVFQKKKNKKPKEKKRKEYKEERREVEMRNEERREVEMREKTRRARWFGRAKWNRRNKRDRRDRDYDDRDRRDYEYDSRDRPSPIREEREYHERDRHSSRRSDHYDEPSSRHSRHSDEYDSPRYSGSHQGSNRNSGYLEEASNRSSVHIY